MKSNAGRKGSLGSITSKTGRGASFQQLHENDTGPAYGRESFGRARSLPLKVKPRQSYYNPPETSNKSLRKSIARVGGMIDIDSRRSRSSTDLDADKLDKGKLKNFEKNLGLGATNEELEEGFVSRHMLYKEAMYTAVHLLGTETQRFPSNKEEICIYVHEAFSISRQEQEAVIEHIKGELFPMIGVNVKILRAEGLESTIPERNPNPYAVVAIESELTGELKDWQQQQSEGPIRRLSRVLALRRAQPAPEKRVQYFRDIPPEHRTSVKARERNPIWDQIFQCICLRPSAEYITVEVWEKHDDDSLKNSMEAYTNTSTRLGEVSAKSSKSKKSKATIKDVADSFLGKISKPVGEISCEGMEKTMHLEGVTDAPDQIAHGKIRVRIWLVHIYRHGKLYVEMVDKNTMLSCLWDWILSFEKKRNPDKNWDGQLPPEANCLLYQYALQTGIGEETHSLIRWEAYARHKLDLDGMQAPMKEMTQVLSKRRSTLTAENPLALGRPEIDDAQISIENSLVQLTEDEIFPIIRNHLREPEERLIKALRSFKNCTDVASKFETQLALPVLQGLMEKALRLCFLEWYETTYKSRVHTVKGTDDEKLRLYAELMNELNGLVTKGVRKYGPEFYLYSGYDMYAPIMYDELQKMVNTDIESLCWKTLNSYNDNRKLRKIVRSANKQEEMKIAAIFSIYASTKNFVETQTQIFGDDSMYPNLTHYYQWFRPMLILWLGFAVSRGSATIAKCVNIDEVTTDNSNSMISTSALDTATVIHQLFHFWQKLMWPDIPERYVIIHFLVELMCYFTVFYAERKFEKLELEGYFDTIDQFDISDRLCIALNNIEYMKETLEAIPEDIKYDDLIKELEEYCGITELTESYKMKIRNEFTVTFANVELIFATILKGIGDRIKPEVARFIRECFERLDTLQTVEKEELVECVDPILNYVDGNIVTLHKSLRPLNFARMLQLFWNKMVQELVIVGSRLKFDKLDDQRIFFAKVLLLIPLFREYFENGDGGLTEEEMDTLEYWDALLILNLYTRETVEVIQYFYGNRGEEQEIAGHELDLHSDYAYGTLSVRVGYWHDKLSVEVIAAEELLPMDDTVSIFRLCKRERTSDPFVEVSIQPAQLFTNAATHRTNIRWKELNPVFNEKFNWDISTEESHELNAVILLTVKDYDIITRNDFLGEAVVPFSWIPGISEAPMQQPMHLHLRTVEPNPILNILRSRTWDSVATKFYNEQITKRIDLDEIDKNKKG